MDEIIAPLEFARLDAHQRQERLKEILRDVVQMFKESRPSSGPLNVHKIMEKYRTVIRLARSLPSQVLKKMYLSLVAEG
jgi:hypothetical protein